MGLVILEKKEPIKKLKCTLQKSGRLAFPEFTSKYLGISLGKYFQFSTDQAKELYIIIIQILMIRSLIKYINQDYIIMF